MRYHYHHKKDYQAALCQVVRLALHTKETTPQRAWEQAANTLYAFVLMFKGNRARHDECWDLYLMAKELAETGLQQKRAAA